MMLEGGGERHSEKSWTAQLILQIIQMAKFTSGWSDNSIKMQKETT